MAVAKVAYLKEPTFVWLPVNYPSLVLQLDIGSKATLILKGFPSCDGRYFI
jgi:hypothetical protein